MRLTFTRFFALTALIYLGLGVYYIYSISQPYALQTGQSYDSQTYKGEQLHTSLDLRLAAKATYPSSPLQVVQNIPISGGLREQIVSFGVPDDHLTEYALLMLPPAPAPAKGYPAIILCHSYYNPDNYQTTLYETNDMRFYASHGFAVIKPDFRGQGLSLHEGVAPGAYYSMGYNTDVMSLISALKQTSYINKSDLNLWGHSLGAYIALRAAVLSPDIKNVILLSGPVGSLTEMYLAYSPPSDENNLDALEVRQAVFHEYGTPATDSPFWYNASPINFVSKSKAHFQIHVGELDRVVPPQLSADLNAALTKAHVPHQYFVYANGDHGLGPQRPLIWSRSLKLLQSNS